MSAARPYGATCVTCSPPVRKRFTSETARQKWVNKHRADSHGGHTARRPEILKDQQTELDLSGSGS